MNNKIQLVPKLLRKGSIVDRDEENWISNYHGDKHRFYND